MVEINKNPVHGTQKQLKTDVIHSKQQLRQAHARFIRHIDGQLRRTGEDVSPGELVFVEAKSAGQPHKLPPVASVPVQVVAVGSPTVTT